MISLLDTLSEFENGAENGFEMTSAGSAYPLPSGHTFKTSQVKKGR